MVKVGIWEYGIRSSMGESTREGDVRKPCVMGNGLRRGSLGRTECGSE